MQTRVQKWGNSLAVRIPKSFASQSHLEQNTLVEMTVENGRIILLPVTKPDNSLSGLLEGVTPDNLHDEIDSDSPVGREAW